MNFSNFEDLITDGENQGSVSAIGLSVAAAETTANGSYCGGNDGKIDGVRMEIEDMMSNYKGNDQTEDGPGEEQGGFDFLAFLFDCGSDEWQDYGWWTELIIVFGLVVLWCWCTGKMCDCCSIETIEQYQERLEEERQEEEERQKYEKKKEEQRLKKKIRQEEERKKEEERQEEATSHQPTATSHQPPATSHQPPAERQEEVGQEEGQIFSMHLPADQI